MKAMHKSWKREWNNHSGDYGAEEEASVYSAFRAGWQSAKRHTTQINKPITLGTMKVKR